MAESVLSNASRQKRMAFSPSSLSLWGGLRRRHAPPPGAGAPHGGRHGTSRPASPVGRTASFIMPPPPHQTLHSPVVWSQADLAELVRQVHQKPGYLPILLLTVTNVRFSRRCDKQSCQRIAPLSPRVRLPPPTPLPPAKRGLAAPCGAPHRLRRSCSRPRRMSPRIRARTPYAGHLCVARPLNLRHPPLCRSSRGPVQLGAGSTAARRDGAAAVGRAARAVQAAWRQWGGNGVVLARSKALP